MTTIRSASVYLRQNDYIIQAESRTTAGVWIGCEPIQILAREMDMTAVGEAIRNALAAFRDGVAHPTDWKALLQPLFKSAKITSWSALQRSAKMCRIEQSDTELRLVPSKNGGTAGDEKGYHSLPGKTISIAVDCSAEQLGKALAQAMEFCC